MKARLQFVGLIIGALLCQLPGVGLAATIKTVAQQGNPAPPPLTATYRKFQIPLDISDATAGRVVAFGRTKPPKQCLFRIDPDSDPDATAVCQRTTTPDGRAYGNFRDATINVTSAIGFASRVTQGRSGVYRINPALVQSIVALTGDPVPAPASGFLKDLSFGRLTDAGDVVFESTIFGGAVVLGVDVNQGIFRCNGGDGNCSSGTGTLTTVVLVNDLVPDRAGRHFCSFNELSASTYGAVFRASTQMDCANTSEVPAVGVFRVAVAGPIVTVALQGETAQSPGGGTTYATVLLTPAISNIGMVAFQGRTMGLLSTTILYLCDPTTCPTPSPASVAVSLGEVDGFGGIFNAFSAPGVSDAGDVAFGARLRDVVEGNIGGAYIHRQATDTIVKISRTGDPVPGSSPPAVFGGKFPPVAMSSTNGKVAFIDRMRRSVSPRQLYAVFVYE